MSHNAAANSWPPQSSYINGTWLQQHMPAAGNTRNGAGFKGELVFFSPIFKLPWPAQPVFKQMDNPFLFLPCTINSCMNGEISFLCAFPSYCRSSPHVAFCDCHYYLLPLFGRRWLCIWQQYEGTENRGENTVCTSRGQWLLTSITTNTKIRNT